MAPNHPPPKTPAAETDLAGVADLLGGRRWFRGNALDDPFALHDRLVRGLPVIALQHFSRRFPLVTKDPAFGRVLASPAVPRASPRNSRSGRLGSQESAQLWRLAVVLVKAAPLLGGAEPAERWLLKPAMGLGHRRPLDLLETPAGCELVADHLIQLEFSVYV